MGDRSGSDPVAVFCRVRGVESRQVLQGGISVTRRLSLVGRLGLLAAALVAALSLTPSGVAGQGAMAKPDGLWDATIATGGAQNQVDIPFRFEIATKGAAAQGFFFEGDRKIESSEGTFAGGVVKLVFDHLNTTLELKLNGETLSGGYTNNRPNARAPGLEMRQFKPTAAGPTPALEGTASAGSRPLAGA